MGGVDLAYGGPYLAGDLPPAVGDSDGGSSTDGPDHHPPSHYPRGEMGLTGVVAGRHYVDGDALMWPTLAMLAASHDIPISTMRTRSSGAVPS